MGFEWKKVAAGIACAAMAVGVQQSASALQFNELMINVPSGAGSDNGQEYMELIGGPSESVAGVTVLVIDNEGSGIGTITHAIALTGGTVGTNGLYLLRDNNAIAFSTPPAGATTLQVTDFNPDLDNDHHTYLLVTNFTGAVTDDLDTNDDGMLETTPWTTLLDAISVENNTGEPDIASGLGGVHIDGGDFVPAFTPDSVIRNPNNPSEVIGFDTLASAAGGPYTPDPTNTTDGAWTQALTPGNVNPGFDADKEARLNEVYINIPAPDADNGNEFVEIKGNAGESMNGVWFVLIDNQGSDIGIVANAIDLSSTVSIGSNGLLLIRDSATVLSPAPHASTRLLVSDFNPDLNNNSNVFMLVTNFTGAVSNDLDTNDDGTLETSPWTTLLDAVGVDDGEGEPAIINFLGGVSTGSQSFTPDVFLLTRNTNALIVGDVTVGAAPGPWALDSTEIFPAQYAGIPLTPGNLNPLAIILGTPELKVHFFQQEDAR